MSAQQIVGIIICAVLFVGVLVLIVAACWDLRWTLVKIVLASAVVTTAYLAALGLLG